MEGNGREEWYDLRPFMFRAPLLVQVTCAHIDAASDVTPEYAHGQVSMQGVSSLCVLSMKSDKSWCRVSLLCTLSLQSNSARTSKYLFMTASAGCCRRAASLTRAMSLFREIGLHHILVAPSDPRAIGFITRKVRWQAMILCFTLQCMHW